MKITAVKGFNDILPSSSSKWQFVERVARDIFALYGFSEMRLPIVEKTEVFKRSIGEATDIVEKEMYTFPDRNDLSLTLRPEGTASAVRAFVENALYAENTVNKIYYMGPMFRYERPQKGRYRQFHQIGAEVFGAGEPQADAEMLAMLMHFFKAIGLTGLALQINSMGCEECRSEYKKALVEYFSKFKGELCENCARRLELNPLRILDCKAKTCGELKKDAPSITNYLCTCCSAHFSEVKSALNALDTPFTENPLMVRGLDYYTKTTFEITTDMLGAQNAVAAGGRYDNLCETFDAPKTPAIGFAMGVERLILLLGDDDEKYVKKPDLFVAAMGATAKKFSLKLLKDLRDNGISCEMEFSDKSLKSQMRRADKSKSRFVLIIGEEEMKSGSAPLRNMSNKEQESLELVNIAENIVKRSGYTP